jgi:hypothetical protein
VGASATMAAVVGPIAMTREVSLSASVEGIGSGEGICFLAMATSWF